MRRPVLGENKPLGVCEIVDAAKQYATDDPYVS
jgi:hypothetical protein